MATTDDRATHVKPNRAGLAVVLAAGSAIGTAPLLIYLRVPDLIPVYFVYAALVLVWQVGKHPAAATESPSVAEWILAGLNAIGFGAVSSMIGLVWYGASWGVLWLGKRGAHLMGWEADLSPAAIAAIIAGIFAGIFTLAVPFIVSDQIPPKLYPTIAGTRSAYFPLTVSPRKPGVAVLLCAAAVIAGALFLDPRGFWFAALFTFILVYVCGPLLDVRERDQSPGDHDVIKALTRLLSAAGYKVTRKPVTGSPEVDPLIAPVDVLALAGNHGYAVKVRLAAASEAPLEWTVASDIRRAAKALQRVLRGESVEPVRIEAYLVVIGGSLSDDLRSFAEEEDVRLAHFPGMEPFTAALSGDATAAALRVQAERLLEVRLAAAPAAPVQSMASAG